MVVAEAGGLVGDKIGGLVGKETGGLEGVVTSSAAVKSLSIKKKSGIR